MRQQTFATGDFERYRNATRREQFLAEMDKVVPWKITQVAKLGAAVSGKEQRRGDA